MKNGKIVLSAATADTKPAGTPTQKVKVSGALLAAGNNPGETGGKVQITGEDIALNSATIDASGPAGGGTVLVGGDVSGGHPNANVVSNPKAQAEDTAVPTATNVTVDPTSKIDVSATDNGDGGKAIVWADFANDFAGTIYAKGGPNGGDGGFAEISGGYSLNYAHAKLNLSAAAGLGGTVLFDPFFTSPINSGEAAAISSQLNDGTNTIVYASHVDVNADIFKTSGPSVWLKIFGDDGITIASNVTIGSTSGVLNIKLDADADYNSPFNFPGLTYPPLHTKEADPDYLGTASSSEHSDAWAAYETYLQSLFDIYAAGNTSVYPVLTSTALGGQDFFTSMRSFMSSSAWAQAQTSTLDVKANAHIYTNGGSFVAFANKYTTVYDTRTVGSGTLSYLASKAPSIYASNPDISWLYLVGDFSAIGDPFAFMQVGDYSVHDPSAYAFYRASRYARLGVVMASGVVSIDSAIPKNVTAPTEATPKSTSPTPTQPEPPYISYSTAIDVILAGNLVDLTGYSPAEVELLRSIFANKHDDGYIYDTGDADPKQCVALVKAIASVGPTGNWDGGTKLTKSAGGYPAIEVGTPIATFDASGNYPHEAGKEGILYPDRPAPANYAHAAIFIGYVDGNGNPVAADGDVKGMLILDQASSSKAEITTKYFGGTKVIDANHKYPMSDYTYSVII